jgi:hypothetical protein
MDNKWFIVVGIGALAFILGRHSKNVSAPVPVVSAEAAQNATPVPVVSAKAAQNATSAGQALTVANGQPYFNVAFQFGHADIHGLSQDYIPLFGFVAGRTAF